ncbi:type III secretion system outer membrane pore InvG [Burkholderia dolosa PC543]|nr:type III secretion system outer membrane pore InvG [Burkholderia dolosa PC543]
MLCCLAMMMSQPASASPSEEGSETGEPRHGYVARKESLRSVFEAISSRTGTPIIVSKAAAAKKMTGNFDLTNPQSVQLLSRQFALINFYDGHTIYVYDASETKNALITLRNASPSAVTNFLKQANLYDARYPVRSNHASTLYVSGPPIYVDLVVQMANSLDQETASIDEKRVEIIKVHNTFVIDRTFTRRTGDVVIPGIATLVQRAIGEENAIVETKRLDASASKEAVNPAAADGTMPALDAAIGPPPTRPSGAVQTSSSHGVRIVAYPETNSLMVKGTPEQVKFVRQLVQALDEEKRHIELALWIIDLEREALDQLGVNWRGTVSLGGMSASLNMNNNTSLSTVGGTEFIASVTALARDRRAQIVSRPVVLTQENTPAVFDSSQTFYAKLVGERAVDLKEVTYGTMVNVVPRFNAKDDIELALNIEDGSAKSSNVDQDPMPTVNRTKISTVARVPKGKSLLVGGYTRGETGDVVEKIPGLGSLPFIGGLFRFKTEVNRDTVRVFLISPREITDGLDTDFRTIDQDADFGSMIRRADRTADVVAQ